MATKSPQYRYMLTLKILTFIAVFIPLMVPFINIKS
jgi:hypothetical protein